MTDTVKIFNENTGSPMFVNMGTNLLQLSKMMSAEGKYPFLAAYVNNTLKDLSYQIFSPVSVRFIDITHFEGIRVYQRTLFFILQKAARDVFPDNRLKIKHSVAKGFYFELEGIENIPQEGLDRLKERTNDIIAQNIPIVKDSVTTQEAEEIYSRLGFDDKLALLHTRPSLYVDMYSLADIEGYFYAPLAISTGYIHLFDIRKYYQGFYLGVPRRTVPDELERMVPQDKMFDIFSEYTNWVSIIGVANIGALNAAILDDRGNELIKIAEAFHEKKLGVVADTIFDRHKKGGSRIIFISGPSSSGKTTFAQRLGIQLSVLGLKPVLISLDDYFVERENTPLDENGEYDYEALEAIDVNMFSGHLQELLDGKEVGVPRYDFITGKRNYGDKLLKLDERSVLVVEGIHGLNPNLIQNIDPKMTFKVYVSALTSISLDNMNRISTTDSRLIRRIVRDARTRGASATATLRRWGSVRRGEEKYIFPNQEMADIMFNSSLFYELAVLAQEVEPLLHEVPDTMPEYGEARRLLKFLKAFTPMSGKEIPLNSILREFIGGSSFKY